MFHVVSSLPASITHLGILNRFQEEEADSIPGGGSVRLRRGFSSLSEYDCDGLCSVSDRTNLVFLLLQGSSSFPHDTAGPEPKAISRVPKLRIHQRIKVSPASTLGILESDSCTSFETKMCGEFIRRVK